ncbi:hypothetical protein CBR_g20006 [Chara braunii]|uniref:MACPF domain-containing protein n=1 Tax=Chara braunii TaxID=69332 RepID=A0A388KZ95_CHABU|nr:hypothetical protein CBR_g20006 [Chara braunii]|eukprot:GBG75376.1 hypothetical protein CBR_g20006 [Chara braunii]
MCFSHKFPVTTAERWDLRRGGVYRHLEPGAEEECRDSIGEGDRCAAGLTTSTTTLAAGQTTRKKRTEGSPQHQEPLSALPPSSQQVGGRRRVTPPPPPTTQLQMTLGMKKKIEAWGMATILQAHEGEKRRFCVHPLTEDECTNTRTSEAALTTAKEAYEALGRGFDVTQDFRLVKCKGRPEQKLVAIARDHHDLVIPGVGTLSNVSRDIKYDRGERIRLKSDVLTFDQMSERFNNMVGIEGDVPLGLFNAAFNLRGNEAQETRAMAKDAWIITLYSLHLMAQPLQLTEELTRAIPRTWEPTELASFIQRFGTHVVTSVRVGGKDAVFLRQTQSSLLSPREISRIITMASEIRFNDIGGPDSKEGNRKLQVKNVELTIQRRGGDETVKAHQLWLDSIPKFPDAIGVTYVAITDLLEGIPGSDMLSHAINLYLHYKPPLEHLRYFLEFQIPKQWTPVPMMASKREPNYPSLQFIMLAPRLYVSTNEVLVERKPVTGLRLVLEGERHNRLAIHMQHFWRLPKVMQLKWDPTVAIGSHIWKAPEGHDFKWFKPVENPRFAWVSELPIQYPSNWLAERSGAYIVTGAQLQVDPFKDTKILSLRLRFSKLPGCSIRRSVWDVEPESSQECPRRLGITGQMLSLCTDVGPPSTEYQHVGEMLAPGDEIQAPAPLTGPTYFSRNIRTDEMKRGPNSSPGHWLVTGAKLHVHKGKISLHVKYSLLHY